jgi:hypothetical protein
MLRGPIFVRTEKAREAWDGMSHEQRKGHARATPVNSALCGKLDTLQQLHDELVEDAIETHRGTSQLEDKLRSSKVVALLDDCEAKLRTIRDELRFERETADKLAELLRGTTRALLEAPHESIRMIRSRLPSVAYSALIRYVNGTRGIDVDTVFGEIKKIRKDSSAEDISKDDGGKRKRAETSDDDGKNGSERVGEGPSDGTRIHIQNLSGGVHDGGVAGTHDSLEEQGVPSTNEFPDKLTDSSAPVSGIVTQKAPTSSSASHTVSPTEHGGTQAPAPVTLASSPPVWQESTLQAPMHWDDSE